MNYLWRRGSPAELFDTELPGEHGDWLLLGDWNFPPEIEETQQKENQTPQVASKHLLEGSILFCEQDSWGTWEVSTTWKGWTADYQGRQKDGSYGGTQMVHVVGHRSTEPTGSYMKLTPSLNKLALNNKLNLCWSCSVISGFSVPGWALPWLGFVNPSLSRAIHKEIDASLFWVLWSSVLIKALDFLLGTCQALNHTEPAGIWLHMETYGTAKE